MKLHQVLILATALPAVTLAATVSAAPAPNGETLFNQRCKACHSAVANKPSPLGPNLAGVVGRKAGSLTFAYSPALKASGLVWTKPQLDKYLTAPTKMVPGTRMVLSVPDAAQRKAIVDYLAKQR
jgi:cytochrome c